MSTILYCSECKHQTEFTRDTGALCCTTCGVVAEDSAMVSELTFGENSAGAATVQGSFISSDQSYIATRGPGGRFAQSGDSRAQTVEKTRQRIMGISRLMGIPDVVASSSLQAFKLALDVSFVKGRKSKHVTAACMYYACRKAKTSFMLMDFASQLHVNVFKLGACYLQLIKCIPIGEDDKRELTKMDPAIFIERFVGNLKFPREIEKQIKNDASDLVTRMGKDWLHEGRRPAGVAAACLLLAARMNNQRVSRFQVVQAAKVAEETIQRRLDEFQETSSATLTVKDFRAVAKNIDIYADPPSFKHPREKLIVPKTQVTRTYAQQLVADSNEFADLDEVLKAGFKNAKDVVLSALLNEAELDAEHREMLAETEDQDIEEDGGYDEEDEEEEEEEDNLFVDNEVEDDHVSEGKEGRRAKIFVPQELVIAEMRESEKLNAEINDNLRDPALQAGTESLMTERHMEGTRLTVNPDLDDDEREKLINQVKLDPPPNDEEEETTVPADVTQKPLTKEPDIHGVLQKREPPPKIPTEVRQSGPSKVSDDPENLTDVDGPELEAYLLTSEEADVKELIWLNDNEEFLLKAEERKIRVEMQKERGTYKVPTKRRKTKPVDGKEFGGTSAFDGASKMMAQQSKKINESALKELFKKGGGSTIEPS